MKTGFYWVRHQITESIVMARYNEHNNSWAISFAFFPAYGGGYEDAHFRSTFDILQRIEEPK